ncbi:phosphatase PAP2 family protein [Patulibacter minatonensis]|uniref:phosphatase PAP2 family protein n=1 Tax=Patulibacter minatonensis TaxID=298163 RepID=UPI0004AD03D4|nr:phosphatase PAP2 family protein [Patulibacter minatonensis]
MPPVVDRSLLQRRLTRAAVVLFALFLFVGLVVRPTGLGDTIDGRTLSALRPLDDDETHAGWDAITHFGAPSSYLQYCLALMLVAAVRRRRRWVLVVPVTMLCSELSAQGIKQLLAGARPDVAYSATIGDAAWPSGHSTAAMTVALLAVLVAPRRMRPTVAVLGALCALGVGIAMVAVGAHYPTDIFGGYLCAALWVTLAAIVLLEWQRRRPVVRPVERPTNRPWALVGPVLLLVLGALTAVSLADRSGGGVVGTVRDHTVAVVVVGVLVALALTLAALTASLPETRDDRD